MYSIELKIPKIRVAVLIGKKGATKKLLESKLKVKLKVSKEGDVRISGESLDNMVAQKVVKAIGRGFNPKLTLNLIKDEYCLEIIDIRDFAGKSKSSLHRVKARLIGSEGRAWKNLEKLCNVDISVHGHTVAIIGLVHDMDLARIAVEKLINGSTHGKVYEFIDRHKERIDAELY